MPTFDTDIAAVRRFSRFYTQELGLLSERLLGSPYTLSEGRLIYELAQRDDASAAEVSRELGLDAGYVSRLLRGLERRGFVEKTRSSEDRRRILLRLSADGKAEYERLSSGSRQQIAEMLARVDPAAQKRVVTAMKRIEEDLGCEGAGDHTNATRDGRGPERSVVFRPHRPGDMGWIVQRHGELYHMSHGWDASFEAMVAEIVAQFIRRYDPVTERSWIAEVDGRRAGAIALVRKSKTIGQLRLLFVEPDARGLGIGARLVSECVSHARHVGYRKMTLFTVASLDAARRLYEREGFELVMEKPSALWGSEQVEQRWDLKL